MKVFSETTKLHGRPRRRFLAEQRIQLASRLLAILVLFAAACAASTALDLIAPMETAWPRSATFLQALTTLALSAGAIVASYTKKELRALQIIAVVEGALITIGCGLVARETGGGQSPYVLAGPLAVATLVALAPLPPRALMALGAFGYLGALPGLVEHSRPSTHLLAMAVVIGGTWLGLQRHRTALSTFLRVERLSARVARMRKMSEKLVVAEKLEALRVLVGGMMHEVNNALAVSVASTEQAQRAAQTDPATAEAAMKRAAGGLARIRNTVDRLRRFARSESGLLEPADLGAMLDFALESAITHARSAIIIERSYDPEVGSLQVNVAALAEALFQVVRNAIDSMPGGGMIRASVKQTGDKVVLSVSDQGSGIPPEDLAKVFDPYYSRGGVNKAGMGLSAVYGLVRSLGGTMEIHSAVGRGTEVAIVMPQK